MGAKQKGVEVIPRGARGTEINMYATHYYNMRRVVLLMMLLPLVVSCGRESKEEASEQTYAMLEATSRLHWSWPTALCRCILPTASGAG